jgi:hypothetical protein
MNRTMLADTQDKWGNQGAKLYANKYSMRVKRGQKKANKLCGYTNARNSSSVSSDWRKILLSLYQR